MLRIRAHDHVILYTNHNCIIARKANVLIELPFPEQSYLSYRLAGSWQCNLYLWAAESVLARSMAWVFLR